MTITNQKIELFCSTKAMPNHISADHMSGVHLLNVLPCSGGGCRPVLYYFLDYACKRSLQMYVLPKYAIFPEFFIFVTIFFLCVLVLFVIYYLFYYLSIILVFVLIWLKFVDKQIWIIFKQVYHVHFLQFITHSITFKCVWK